MFNTEQWYGIKQDRREARGHFKRQFSLHIPCLYIFFKIRQFLHSCWKMIKWKEQLAGSSAIILHNWRKRHEKSSQGPAKQITSLGGRALLMYSKKDSFDAAECCFKNGSNLKQFNSNFLSWKSCSGLVNNENKFPVFECFFSNFNYQ